MLQSIGRGLRMSDSKSACTLYDISDDLMIEGDDFENYSYRHNEVRKKIYAAEQFNVTEYHINI